MSGPDGGRPRFHIRPRAGWLNDPNGVIRWRDRYHVFFQHNPDSATWGTIHWGHVSSPDLVHWQHEPIALAPDPAGYDADGCWSGCIVDDGGTPTLLYTARHGEDEVVCLAIGDAELRSWRKDPGEPVLTAPRWLPLSDFRDPKVWREADGWHMVIGAGHMDGPGTVLQFQSPDLRHWEALGAVLVGNEATRGQVWECPDFFAIDGHRVLLYSVTPGEESTRYAQGAWDGRALDVANHGVLDLGPYFYAAQTQVGPDGDRIVWGWIREGRSLAAQRQAGWSGALSLPRRITVDGLGHLEMRPAAELEALRGSPTAIADLCLEPGASWDPGGDAGTAYEMALLFRCAPGARLQVEICRSPDGQEVTVIACDPGAGDVTVLRDRSSCSPYVDDEPHVGVAWPGRPETAELRLFLDGSIVELCSGSRWLTTRVYPHRTDSTGVRLTALGGAVDVVSFQLWPMSAAILD